MNTFRPFSLDTVFGGLLVVAGIAWSALPFVDQSAPSAQPTQIVRLERVVVVGHRDSEVTLAAQSHAPRVN